MGWVKKMNLIMPLSKKIYNCILLIAVIWLVFGLDVVIPYQFTNLGIIPREISGMWGIVCAPFLHVNLTHIISNTLPLFVLTLMLLVFYEKQAFLVWVGIAIIGGSFVWLFAGLFSDPSVHVGASGVIYGLVAFLVVSGIFQKSTTSILISFVVLIAYGSLIFGIFPSRPHISWQGHLFGALSGVLMAYAFKQKLPAKNRKP